MKLDLKVYLSSCVQLFSLAATPQLPPPPSAFGRYWSAKIDDISLWSPDAQWRTLRIYQSMSVPILISTPAPPPPTQILVSCITWIWVGIICSKKGARHSAPTALPERRCCRTTKPPKRGSSLNKISIYFSLLFHNFPLNHAGKQTSIIRREFFLSRFSGVFF
jgi:hypothetical protein